RSGREQLSILAFIVIVIATSAGGHRNAHDTESQHDEEQRGAERHPHDSKLQIPVVHVRVLLIAEVGSRGSGPPREPLVSLTRFSAPAGMRSLLLAASGVARWTPRAVERVDARRPFMPLPSPFAPPSEASFPAASDTREEDYRLPEDLLGIVPVQTPP